jgi:hypothetical protein
MAKTANPGAEAFGRAHAALERDLRKLEEAVGSSSGMSPAEVVARLGATQTHVREHFCFEEQDGYMDTIRQREPRLERAIQHLVEEHRQLAQSLEALLGEARTAPSLHEAFRDKVRTWVGRLRGHEAHEIDLVQEAFNWDIGAED